jgi:cytochrome b involved in lipid metabolism
VSGGLSPNGVAGVPKGRGKVLLKPGHSPMDWAALMRSGNLSGVDTFQRITPSQLKTMTGRKGKPAWSSWQGKVYNITPYLPFHPGGEPELMKAAGRDGTQLFMDVHPWVNWENMLGPCLVGVLVPENYAASSLEDMD